LRNAQEVEVELRVGIKALQFLGELQGEDGLPDAAGTAETEDGAGTAIDERGPKGLQIVFAAGEVAGWGGELVEGGRGRGDGDRISVDDLDGSTRGGNDIVSALSSVEESRSPRI
jgi:hypothetical protein